MSSIHETTIAGAWNVQGDLRRLALALPEKPNTVARYGGTVAFWLGPRSWLMLGDRTPQTESGAVFDLSASRVAFTVCGAQAAMVLAKHCPLDFDPSRFAPGTCAQSLFGQVNALYYRHATRAAFTVFVARSFARDVAHRLRASAAQYGYDDASSRPFVAD